MCNKFKWIEKLCLHPEQPTYVHKITFEFANSYVFVDFSLYLTNPETDILFFCQHQQELLKNWILLYILIQYHIPILQIITFFLEKKWKKKALDYKIKVKAENEIFMFRKRIAIKNS